DACLLSLHLLLYSIAVSAPSYFSTLSLHDALPISGCSCQITWPRVGHLWMVALVSVPYPAKHRPPPHRTSFARKLRKVALLNSEDRKSTRLNSSHGSISYAVFCLKKKKK